MLLAPLLGPCQELVAWHQAGLQDRLEMKAPQEGALTMAPWRTAVVMQTF